VTVGPVVTGPFGTAYLIAALALGAGFPGLALVLLAHPTRQRRAPPFRFAAPWRPSWRWPLDRAPGFRPVDRERARALIKSA
jgi:hypothetical protein